jgi:hypothetical protein
MNTCIEIKRPIAAAFAALLLLLGPAGTAMADNKHLSLAQWQDLYTRWEFGNITLPTDSNGNAAENGTVLMAIPSAPGDGTPGHLDVTLHNAQPFFLPLFQALGTSYKNNNPPDAFIDLSYFTSFDVSLKIDGVTVIDNSTKMNFFSESILDPPIPFSFRTIDAIIYVQGFGIAHGPLSVGTHTIQLDETPAQNLFPAEYHNTWTVTVLP